MSAIVEALVRAMEDLMPSERHADLPAEPFSGKEMSAESSFSSGLLKRLSSLKTYLFSASR
jgi:hypothetical protein